MIERTWLRFRRLPRTVRVVAWILLAPLVAAVWLWRAPRAGVAARTGSVILALLSLPFYVALFSGPAATPSTPSSPSSPSSPSGSSGSQVLADQSPAAIGTPEPAPVPVVNDAPALPSPTPSAPPAAAPTPSKASPTPKSLSPPAPVPARGPTTPRTTIPPVVTPPSAGCEPSYPGFCIRVGSPDLDCPEISYTNFEVRYDVPDPDPHGFDADHDGIGCEKK